jgi:GTP cyclohydrolase II
LNLGIPQEDETPDLKNYLLFAYYIVNRATVLLKRYALHSSHKTGSRLHSDSSYCEEKLNFRKNEITRKLGEMGIVMGVNLYLQEHPDLTEKERNLILSTSRLDNVYIDLMREERDLSQMNRALGKKSQRKKKRKRQRNLSKKG